MTEPAWLDDTVWWHVYPLGFAGADPTGVSRAPTQGLRRIADWLDYAVALGVSGLQLGPIFASSSHGYDTADYFRIDERLGTSADFDDLVARLRDKGLRLLLDGVFNHVGPDFVAPADWYATDADGQRAVFEGHPGLPALDHANPAVADHVVSVMHHWLSRGADGWRLDAAYAVPSQFWASVLPRVRDEHPNAYLVGEVIHGDYAATVSAGRLDAVTQYELWKAIWSSLNDRNFFELGWALRRHDEWLADFVPLTFVGNHDVTRLASKVTDARHLPHALVVLMTVGGTPSLYYGDEQGWTGVKEDKAGGDDAVRQAFPPSPDLIKGNQEVLGLHRELIAVRRQHSWLHRATTTSLLLGNQQFVYEVTDGARRLRVALNLADEELRHASLAGQAIAGAVHDSAVPAHGWAIIEPAV